MKLSQMELKPMHCVVYTKDGNVAKTFKQEQMEKIIAKKSTDEYVIIYYPNDDMRKEVLTAMQLDGDKVKLEGIKVLTLIEKLTNIDLGLESGELTLNEALDIINNPNPVLQTVSQIVNQIFMTLLSNQLDIMQGLAQLPEEVKQPLLDEIVNKGKRDEEAKRQAQIDALMEEQRKQQEEFEAKIKALRGE